MEILYIATDADSINDVAPLWELMKQHHVERSTHFKSDMEAKNWKDRREEMLHHADGGRLRVDLAYHDNNVIGYCISVVNKEGQGEVEYIYIDPDYRKQGIGSSLINRADTWFNLLGVKTCVIAVAAGNEEVFPFYAKLGYHPRATILSRLQD